MPLDAGATRRQDDQLPLEAEALMSSGGIVKTVAWVAGLTGTALLLREAFLAFSTRRRHRATLYDQAMARSIEQSKMLIVVGSPLRGLAAQVLGPAYGCGDLCVDTNGCPTCATYLAGPIVDLLGRFQDNSAVIYAADVIESAPDAAALLHQLRRVSGGDLYIAHLEPTSLAAWTSRRRVYAAPEGPAPNQQVIYRANPWSPEPVMGLHVVMLGDGSTQPPPIAWGSLGNVIDTTGE